MHNDHIQETPLLRRTLACGSLGVHQHELAKLPFIETYDLIVNPYRSWGETHRPFPEKCRWVNHFRKNYYDFAILHVDQQSIYDPEKGDRISKGKIYMELREVIGDDCPIVTINHMTPFHDKYDGPYVVDFIKKMTKGTFMVVNSHEAAKQWGWGHTVIHGLEVDEWWDLPKEPRAVTVLSPEGMEKAYRRMFLNTVRRMLKDAGVPFVWVGVDEKVCRTSFDAYREYLGRSLVFFMPTWQSPRPRARTEGMMSGCCIVTTPYQDADTFIEHGVNGFLTDRLPTTEDVSATQAVANLIKRLVMDEPDLALKVGQEGKRTARELFTKDKFTEQWVDVIGRIGIKLQRR